MTKKQTTMQKVYISGPMTGLPKSVYQHRFAMAEDNLRAGGYQVINPSTDEYYKYLCLENLPYKQILVADLTTLSYCDAIYMLEGWQQSHGATVEHCFAENTGIKIMYQ